MSARERARRGGRRGPLVRGELVVRRILEAALEELGRAGYSALRVDDVAARAGVNKTTVYRRWPTKEDLVRAALLSITADRFALPSTGSLRGDLFEIAKGLVALSSSCQGQGLGRMMLAEGPDSELMAIARSLRDTYEAVPRSIIEAAKVRGELAPGVDAMLLFDILVGALHKKLWHDREGVDDAYLGRAIDLILHGALAPEKRRELQPARDAGARAAIVSASAARPRGTRRATKQRG